MSATARRQGHTYDAEVILLILDRMMQGSGVGARLFDGMEQAFRQAGAQRYFLYTNTGCNVGFYDHRGLTRRIERTVSGQRRIRHHLLPLRFCVVSVLQHPQILERF